MKPKTDGLKAGYDIQLKTPKHDQLCLEYVKKENENKILSNVSKLSIARTKQNLSNELNNIYEHEIKKEYLFDEQSNILIEKGINSWDNSIYEIKGNFIKKEYEYVIKEQFEEIKLKHYWEYPIQINKFLIGVIDFKTDVILQVTTKIITKTKTSKSETQLIKKETFSKTPPTITFSNYRNDKELAEKQEYKLIKTDETEKTHVQSEMIAIIFSEIKPTIDSIGEVMRQLKIYTSYIGQPMNFERHRINLNHQKTNIALVTYGEKNRHLFEEQGFIYINLGEIPKDKSNINNWSDLE
jgi:hypothetical protein